MSRSAIKIALSLGAAVLFSVAVALAGKGKTIDIYTDAVLPDGQELKAGKYDVLMDEAGTQVEFVKGTKVVAKHPCKCVNHPEKNRYNQARYVEGAQKKQQLQEIRLGGESRTIVLNPQGM